MDGSAENGEAGGRTEGRSEGQAEQARQSSGSTPADQMASGVQKVPARPYGLGMSKWEGTGNRLNLRIYIFIATPETTLWILQSNSETTDCI